MLPDALHGFPLDHPAVFVRSCMTDTSTVLSFFKEKSTLDTWAPSLSKFRGVPILLNPEDIRSDCFRSEALGFTPQLAIVSSDLYPDVGTSLIRQLRLDYPDLDVVVLAAPNVSRLSLWPLVRDGIRHLAVADPVRESEKVATLIKTLASKEPWTFSLYLNSESDFREFRLFHAEQKEYIIRQIESLVCGQAADLEILRQKGALLADEMIENALQAAPEGALSPKGIWVKAGFDGETLALQVIDNWGTLTPEKAMEYLARHQDGQVCIDTPRGRGLFILWQFFDHFHLNILSGQETAIGGQLNRKSTPDNGLLKGFDFFQDSPCARSFLSRF
jgi:anti-sigma regulatory factor (Ser/Thr protein kinase)